MNGHASAWGPCPDTHPILNVESMTWVSILSMEPVMRVLGFRV